jgi:hypothetical protein
LALREDLLLTLEFLPSHPIHALDAAPVGGHLLLQLLDARHHFPHYPLRLRLDSLLQLLHLLSQNADLRVQPLGVQACLLVDVLIRGSLTFR